MAEPIEMSKARNAYAKERDRFRRELQWALRQYEGRPLSFEIKQNIRFIASDLKEDCMNAYRHATKNIANNQPGALIGTSLRIRSMANSEDALSSLKRNKSPNRRFRTQEDDEDINDFIARNRASGITGRSWALSLGSGKEPSVPISKLTFGAHRSATTNTHVLAFEKQLKEEIDQMIQSIDYLDDKNRSNWLAIPKSDRSQYFSSRYDDTRYSVPSYTTSTPIGVLAGSSPHIGLSNSSKFGDISGIGTDSLRIGEPKSTTTSTSESTTSFSSTLESSSSASNAAASEKLGLAPSEVEAFYEAYLSSLSKPKPAASAPAPATATESN